MLGWAKRLWTDVFGEEAAEPVEVPFAADFPITNASQDLLGRSEFSHRIADTLACWRGDASLVLAIRSAWGNGKSSVKNLVVERLQTLGPTAPYVVDFNPWRYGNSEAISAAFYREIGIALGDADKSIGGYRRKRAFKKYARFFTHVSEGLKVGGAGVVPTLTSLANVGLITVGVGALIGAPYLKVLAWGLIVSGVLGLFAKLFTYLGSDNPTEPLHVVRADLEKRLRKLSRPILVIVDDIDRLDSEEIRVVFRHVKANADLPQLTYLLLFQREIVERALEPVAGSSARDYLEKIIQAAFDLPAVEPARIEIAVQLALDKIMGSHTTEEAGFNRVRWGNVFYGGMRAYFRNLRDVHRFAAAVSVHFTLHNGARALEVNPIDFLALETLRVFEPAIYAEVATNKAAFTKMARDEGDGVREQMKAVVELSSAATRPSATALIKELFPPVRWAFPHGMHYSAEHMVEWQLAKRICTPRHFDRYFALRIPDKEISESELTEILERTNDRQAIDAIFDDMQARGLLGVLFARLDECHTRIPLENAETILPAMFDRAECSSDSVGFDLSSPFMSAWRAASWYLRRIQALETRGAVLLNCLRIAAGLSAPGVLIGLEDDRRAKSRGEETLLLTDDQLAKAKAMWVSKVTEQASDVEYMLSNPHLITLLHGLIEFGAEDEAKRWFENVARSSALPRLLCALVSEGQSHTMGDYVARTTRSLHPGSVVKFMSPDTLKSLAEALDTEKLSSQEQEAVALARAMSEFRSSTSDDEDEPSPRTDEGDQ